MAFLVVDVGGAGLVVEVQTTGAGVRYDTEGVNVRRAPSGKSLVTITYDPRETYPFTSRHLTEAEFTALRAAAQWPKTIVVGGDAIRPATTMNAKVLVSQADFMPVGLDYFYIAAISVEKAD